ncbi:hypothetical protein KJ866_02010 [Patescibacteria group bacterium]|nr:hypothetical protein [Patescibacteria group bacterium]
MGMHDTTAKEVATKRLREAQRKIKLLRSYLGQIDQAIKHHEELRKGEAFHISWCEKMMGDALGIYNEIARCNGAVLVRATEPAKDKAAFKGTNLVTCEADGSRCNLCGGMIPDGDFICVSGHEIGEQYPVSI